MKLYLMSLGAGLLVGMVYGMLNVRSPAPPVIALVGLLGILIGEQAVPLLRHVLVGGQVDTGWFDRQCRPHVLGHLPGATGTDAPCPPDRG